MVSKAIQHWVEEHCIVDQLHKVWEDEDHLMGLPLVVAVNHLNGYIDTFNGDSSLKLLQGKVYF